MTRSGLHRRALNIGYLVSADAISIILGLCYVVLTARSLGPAGFGVLALIVSYVQGVERFVSFQVWQPLIRYGAMHSKDGDRHGLMMLFKFGYVLDLVAAATASLLAVTLAVAASFVLGWSSDTLEQVLVFCLTLAFAVNGTPVAILRLAGRFGSMAYGEVASASARLLLCAVAFASSASLWTFVVIWAATQIIGALVTNVLAWRELRRQGLDGLWKVSLRGVTRRFPGLISLVWYSSLTLKATSSVEQFDTLLVGALTDPASAGLYNIAKRVARLMRQLGARIQAVLYPEIARLWAVGAHGEFQRLIAQTEIVIASFGLASLVAIIYLSEPAIRLFMGADFIPAAPLMIVQIVAVILTLVGQTQRDALLTMGREAKVFGTLLTGTLMFYLIAALLIPIMGPMGANVAHVALSLTSLVGLSLLYRSSCRSERNRKATEPDAENVSNSLRDEWT